MLEDIIDYYQIVLASNSPRRQELLKEIVPEFEIKTKEIDESYPNHLIREEVAQYLSDAKSDAFGVLSDHQMVITADTIVCLDKKVLGKPGNKEDALKMLISLSGRTHTVITGVTLRTKKKKKTLYDRTEVTFYPFTENELLHYIETFQPYDKAGAYGIQEWLGQVGVQKIEGDYYNVMGLPLHKIYTVLKHWDQPSQ